MAHIQHELLENQKCDTLQFYGVAYYLITIVSVVLFCYFDGINLYKNTKQSKLGLYLCYGFSNAAYSCFNKIKKLIKCKL